MRERGSFARGAWPLTTPKMTVRRTLTPWFHGFAKKTRRGEAGERTAITMRRGGTGKARAMHGMMAGVQPPIADLNMCVQGAEGTTRDGCAKGSHPK